MSNFLVGFVDDAAKLKFQKKAFCFFATTTSTLITIFRYRKFAPATQSGWDPIRPNFEFVSFSKVASVDTAGVPYRPPIQPPPVPPAVFLGKQ